jgi:nitric oxide reductase NorQ protein
MSSTTTSGSPDSPEEQVILSHLVNRLLQREGGNIPVERVTLRVSDYADLSDQDAADLIDDGADAGIYTLNRSQSGSATIAGVSPQGPEPQVITDAFGELQHDTGADFRVISVVTDSINDALHDAGYDDFTALASASTDDIAGLTGTLTESRAENILKEAQRHVPIGHRLAQRAAAYYSQRSNPDTGLGEARVTDLSLVIESVGEPRFLAEGWDPDDERGMYVSNIGRNAGTPVPTGLHILDNPDHQSVPKAATHPDASYDALPVDEPHPPSPSTPASSSHSTNSSRRNSPADSSPLGSLAPGDRGRTTCSSTSATRRTVATSPSTSIERPNPRTSSGRSSPTATASCPATAP